MSWNDHVGPDWDTLRLTNLTPLLDQDTEALSSATFQDCVSVHWEHRWSQRPDDAHCPRLDNAHCPRFPNSQESFDSYVLICLRMILALPRQENGFSARESKPEGIRSEFGGTQVSTRKWVQASLLKMSSHDLMCVQTVEVCADSDCRAGWGVRLHLSTHISDEHCATAHPRAAVFSGCQSALVDEVRNHSAGPNTELLEPWHEFFRKAIPHPHLEGRGWDLPRLGICSALCSDDTRLSVWAPSGLGGGRKEVTPSIW